MDLVKVLNDAIDSKLSGLNTMLPGKVVRVDVTKGVCDVQPLIKRKYSDGTVSDMPVITNVPIANYRAGVAFISLPLKVGNYVEIRFCQRSLDIWLNKGGSVDPFDIRKFHLSDAVAYPGMYPLSDVPTGATADDIIIKNNQSKITIKPNGKFLFAGASDEILDVLTQVVTQLETIADKLSSTTTNTQLGPQPLQAAGDFASAKSAITTLKGKLQGLKG